MTAQWSKNKLINLTTKIGSGATPKGGKAAYKAEGISLIRSMNVHDNYFKPKDLAFIDELQAEKLSNVVVEKLDVLLNITGASVARCTVVNESYLPARVNQHVAILRPKSEIIDSQFLSYLLVSHGYKKKLLHSGNKAGSTREALTKTQLQNFEVEFPDIPVQKRIVAILDQAFTEIEQARALAERNLNNARELFESHLQQVFSQRGEGWIEMTLKEASVDFGRGKSKHRPRNDESLYGGDYPFVQTGDVRNCEHVITNYSKTYNKKGLAQSKLWPRGTICITIAANIAETGILDFDSCFPDSVIGVVVNPEKTTVRYVEYLLQSFKTMLQAKGKGSAQDNINMGTFENLKFPFPSVKKQDSIVSSLDTLMTSVQKLEVIYSDKLSRYDELKKSILQQAFSGQLTSKDVT